MSEIYFEVHLGGNYYVRGKKGWSNLYMTVDPFPGLPRPSHDMGIILNGLEARSLFNCIDFIASRIPELSLTLDCKDRPGHNMDACMECNPRNSPQLWGYDPVEPDTSGEFSF